ncbi:MAG: hypothetical protein SCL54_09020, partial [Bacillota bacterium]|nr:hypothetical protein [Bacillota bacterium]
MDKYDLMNRSKEELIMLVGKLMDKLTEQERLEFVSKWISPQVALEEANEFDSSIFVKKVELFCKECLDGKYFEENDYDQYYYEYDEEMYDYSDSEWAEKFTTFLKLAVMYARNKKYDVSYGVLDQLLNCLHEAEFDGNILGTEDPMAYLEIDWDDIFNEYYISMKNHLSDKKQLASKAVDLWISFGDRYTEGILNNIDEIKYVEESIRMNIADYMDCWPIQHQLYELLKKFYLKFGLEFDEIVIARSFVCYNPNFLNDVAQGYIGSKMWDKAILTLKDALNEISDERMILEVNKKLVDCYESLAMFNEAYDIALGMFKKNNTHELYLRARSIATELGIMEEFLDNMESHFRSNNRYDSITTLLRIMSFEGNSLKLIDIVFKSDGYSRHDYLKYATKSLIYRVLGTEKNISSDLNELIKSVEINRIAGIVDMTRNPLATKDKQLLLHSAIEMLKQMAQFHINAAQRTRYARAAYYLSVA